MPIQFFIISNYLNSYSSCEGGFRPPGGGFRKLETAREVTQALYGADGLCDTHAGGPELAQPSASAQS